MSCQSTLTDPSTDYIDGSITGVCVCGGSDDSVGVPFTLIIMLLFGILFGLARVFFWFCFCFSLAVLFFFSSVVFVLFSLAIVLLLLLLLLFSLCTIHTWEIWPVLLFLFYLALIFFLFFVCFVLFSLCTIHTLEIWPKRDSLERERKKHPTIVDTLNVL